MGKGLLYQSHITPGIECVAVCDVDIQKCIDALNMLQLPFELVSSAGEVDRAISRNNVAVCKNGNWI